MRHEMKESLVMRNISLGLGIVALIVGAVVSAYAYVNYTVDSKLTAHDLQAKELGASLYFPNSKGIVIETEIKEINKKLDKLLSQQDEILQRIPKK